jgi:hypothetical protein
MNDAAQVRGNHEHGACQRDHGPAARSSKRGRKQGPQWRDPAQKLRATCDVTACAARSARDHHELAFEALERALLSQLDFALALLAIAKL